jgi:hypothetical protein
MMLRFVAVPKFLLSMVYFTSDEEKRVIKQNFSTSKLSMIKYIIKGNIFDRIDALAASGS